MNVLLIGMGMVAQTHVLALRDSVGGVRLTAVLGRDPARTQAFCDAAGATTGHPVRAVTDIDAALATSPDMAILITPPNARAPYATALSGAGVPTLMEKPIERTYDAAAAIVTLYTQAGVPLGLCFQHRTRTAAQTLKARLVSGDLGEIVHVDMRVPWWRDQSYYDAPGRGSYDRDGGGVMINQAIHTLDLGLWLTGPVAALQAQMQTSPLHVMEAEDIASALLTFRSGATGVLSASTTAYPGGAETITLTTTQAQAHLEGDSLRIHWHDGIKEVFAPDTGAATGSGADPMAFTHAWHQAVIEDFAASLRGGTAPIAPAHDGLHVHAVITAMEHAARTGTRTEVAL
ncbi:MAG: Gfo/Idh/MocA family oxidoreductase [Pseudomonadota bacterium]